VWRDSFETKEVLVDFHKKTDQKAVAAIDLRHFLRVHFDSTHLLVMMCKVHYVIQVIQYSFDCMQLLRVYVDSSKNAPSLVMTYKVCVTWPTARVWQTHQIESRHVCVYV